MGTFILLVIFGTHVFPNDKDVIKFIRSLPSMQDKQRVQQEIAEIFRQRQECQREQCEIWYMFLCMKKHGMMWASQQAREKNLIATLVNLVKIIGNTGISQRRQFLRNGEVLVMH